MIDYRLKYQASIFLNALDMGATPKNISDMITDFSDKGFIPNIFQEINSQNSQPQNRFCLQSPNNEWRINIATTRIDVEKNPTDLKGSNLGSESDFCREAADFFCRIINRFPRKANRLAFVSRFLLNEMPTAGLNDTYNKLFNSPALYEENIPFEWNWRIVSHIEKNITDDKSELFNFVTSINRINGEVRNGNSISNIDRLDLSLDINSIPTRIDDRFGCDEIKCFLKSVTTWHEELKNDIFTFIK